MRAEVDYKQIGKKITELIMSAGTEKFSFVPKRMDGAFYGTLSRAIQMYDTNTMLIERVYCDDSIGMMNQKVQKLNKESEEVAKKIANRKAEYFEYLDALQKEELSSEDFLQKAKEEEEKYLKFIEDETGGIEVGYVEEDSEVPVFKYFDSDQEKSICPVFNIKEEKIENIETYYELIATQMLSVYDVLIYGGVNKLASGNYVIVLHKINTPQFMDIVAKFIDKDEAYESGILKDDTGDENS